MADPLIASAFVKIKPEPTSVSSFGKDVRGKLEKSFTRPVKIKVEPQLLPFKSKIQKELSTAVFTIRVTPVLAPGFKSTVSKLAKTAAAEVSVPVSLRAITPAGRLPGAAQNVISARAGKPVAGPAASTAASREAAFQKELRKLTDIRTISTRKLTEAQQAQGSVTDRLSAANSALSKAEGVVEKHLNTQVRLEGTLTKKQSERLASATRRAQASVAVAAGIKAELEATIARDAADRKTEATTASLTQMEGARLKILQSLTVIEQAGALATTTLGAARAKLTAATAAHTAAETLATEAAALHAEAGTVESLAMKNLADSLVLAAAAEKTKRFETAKGIKTDLEAAAAAEARAAKQALLTRGLIATALAAAGARGATLAASFQFLAGAAIATGLFKSVQLASQLEEELNVLAVTANATAEEMEAVSKRALELGADITLPSVSANEAAEAMTELAKAGLSVEESMAAARGTLQLATAAQIDNAEAVNITASALNAFGLAGDQATHVADLLAGSANEAQGGIGDMGASLSSVASVARQAGLSIEDTVAFLTLLAKNGIQGAEAGTALRVALIRLIAPTKKAKDELAALGVNVLDSLGQVRPEVFADISRATEDLTASQRNAALGIIFGTRAIRAQAVIGREGIAGLNDMRDATNQLGLANELAGARTQGFGGKVEALRNTAATTGLNLGQVLIPALDLIFQGLNKDVEALNKFISGLRELGSLDFKGFGLPGDEAVTDAFDPSGVGTFLDEVTAGIPVIHGFFDPISGQSEEAKRALERLGETYKALAGNFIPLATQVQAKFAQGGEQGAVKFIQHLKDQITDTTPQGAQLLSFLETFERAVLALGRAPTDIELKVLLATGGIPDELAKVQGRISSAPPLKIKAGFAEDSLVFLEHSADVAAEKAAASAHDRFAIIFGSQLAADPLGRAQWDPFFLKAREAAEKAAEEAAEGFSTKFSTFLAVQEASGATDAERLADLRGLLPGAERRFRRAKAQQERAPTEEHEAFLAFASARLNEINAEIESILEDQATAAKAGADKIAKARNEADKRFLDAMGIRQGKLENAILRAEGNTRLQDDIKTHTDLRDDIKRSIAEAKSTIRDATTKGEVVADLTKKLIQENQTIEELNRQLLAEAGERLELRLDIAQVTGTVKQIRKLFSERLKQLRAALADAQAGSKIALQLQAEIVSTRQAAFDAINEGFEIDIQIAEAQERPGAEIKARQRFIEQLKRERAQFKEGTLEYKRLTLEIINQQKAIEEAGGALKDRNRAFAQMSFEFLTTMQGFTANVMGNLLPMGAIGTTVANKLAGASPGVGGPGGKVTAPGMGDITDLVGQGGTRAGPAAALAEQGRVADAERVGGFTAAQAATLIQLTKQIVQLLGGIDSKGKHPESKRAKKAAGGSLDVM